MGRLLNVATVVLGLYLGWRHFFGAPPAPPPTVAGLHADIEIYTTPQCPYCRDAKAYMDERGIDYLEKDVETDLEARKEFHQRGGRGDAQPGADHRGGADADHEADQRAGSRAGQRAGDDLDQPARCARGRG